MSLSGQAAVVVGGARGTGRACVEALLKRGAKVCFGDVLDAEGIKTREELEAQYGGDKVLYRKCDISEASEVKGLFDLAVDMWGTISIVINVAGYMDEFNFDKCIDVNLRGNILCVNTALEHMGKHTGGAGGVIVIMSSIGGLQPVYWGPVYAATKHALVGYVRSMATPEQFSVHGVRINTVCAGAIETVFRNEVEEHRRIHLADKMIADLKKEPPAQTPAEIAERFLQLIEDTTQNGQALVISTNHGTMCATFSDKLYM